MILEGECDVQRGDLGAGKEEEELGVEERGRGETWGSLTRCEGKGSLRFVEKVKVIETAASRIRVTVQIYSVASIGMGANAMHQ